MKDGRLYTQDEIQIIAKSIIGKSLNDILKEKVKSIENEDKNKGNLGQLIEKYVFNIDNNSFSEADFSLAKIELKLTPYKKLKNGELSAKERLVLNIIDYMNEYKNNFEKSHFWKKNNKIELIWYLYEDGKNKKDFKITNEILLDLSKSEDLTQIKEDWNYIIKKIKQGKAHELSEADTMYLGACSKGANSLSTRKQPYSEIYAMQRAFCFKTSYMTQLVRKYIGNFNDVEKILSNTTNTLQSFINKTIEKYVNKTQNELIKEFKITTNPKNINNIIIRKMFNIKNDLSKAEEFQKANIIPRTIRIEENGKIKESLSFPYFKYTDLIKESWETSTLRDELETTKYLFFIFKKINNNYVFKGTKLWNMPENDINTYVMEMWKNTYNIIHSGNIIKEIKNGKRKTNFINSSQNPVCHVRPHAINAKDTTKLPIPDKKTGLTEYTKHCFWINSKYLENILQDFK